MANPCNTNCLIARSHAPKVPTDRWFAMTRLDQNRAAALLAKKALVTRGRGHIHDDLGQPQRHSVPRLQERQDQRQAGDPGDLRCVLVHGDVHPDGGQARVRGHQGPWRFVGRLGGQRGDRQRASRSICQRTKADWFSAAVVSDGSYGIPAGLIYSFPLVSKGNACMVDRRGMCQSTTDARAKLDASAAELVSERDAVKELLGPAFEWLFDLE